MQIVTLLTGLLICGFQPAEWATASAPRTGTVAGAISSYNDNERRSTNLAN